MDSIYPFSGYHLCKHRKEDKRIEQTQLTRVNNKQQSETKLVRIEDIQDIQL